VHPRTESTAHIWQVAIDMSLFYVALFLACLTGVCALVMIGDKLRRMYVDWLASTDICTSNEPGLDEARHGHFESLVMQ
jgi:hypothetical protein